MLLFFFFFKLERPYCEAEKCQKIEWGAGKTLRTSVKILGMLEEIIVNFLRETKSEEN